MHSHQHIRDDDDDDDDDDRDTQSPGSGTGLGDRTWHLPLPEICPHGVLPPRKRLSRTSVPGYSWDSELSVGLGVRVIISLRGRIVMVRG